MDLDKFSSECYDELLKIHKELCLIPAPSHFEDERAKYVLNFLKECNISNAHIDDAKNVVCSIGEKSEKSVLFMAHTDTVFPMDTKLTYKDDGKKIYCPGVGDDTCSLAVMLMTVKYMMKNGIVPKREFLIAANSCEEGLGNLKGCRKIFEDYKDKIEYMYSFDSKFYGVTNDSVGSHRYKVTVKTEGGHSFESFGNRNAIDALSRIIDEMYKIEVPKKENSKTTYNVGIINGGTSVNTIAQEASMLCEYRSNNVECLCEMEKKFKKIFEKAKDFCSEIEVELVGNRPCMDNMDMDGLNLITDRAVSIQSKHTGTDVVRKPGSTDCNIPHSMGIPAVALANYNGGGTHTLEEWIEKDSLKPGLKITMELMLTEGGLM